MTEASESTEKLLKGLWEAATNLRGVVGPAEYKHYVLPIIFLRFLSVKYEQRKRELENLAHDPKSEYCSKSSKFIQMTLDDISLVGTDDEYLRSSDAVKPNKSKTVEMALICIYYEKYSVYIIIQLGLSLIFPISVVGVFIIS